MAVFGRTSTNSNMNVDLESETDEIVTNANRWEMQMITIRYWPRIE